MPCKRKEENKIKCVWLFTILFEIWLKYGLKIRNGNCIFRDSGELGCYDLKCSDSKKTMQLKKTKKRTRCTNMFIVFETRRMR